MKTIDTLVEDIHKVFLDFHSFDEARLEKFGKNLLGTLVNKINPEQRAPYLRLSNLGTKCWRKLWYTINKPNNAEFLPVEARIKFLYGDVLEELLLFLAEEAGHKVEGRQTELDLHGVKGRRDAVIDGVVVDCKSASSYSFKKFKAGLTIDEDNFGYVDQLQGYLEASQQDPLVTDKTRAAFLVIDKTLGHITLDIHNKSNFDYAGKVAQLNTMLASKEPPQRSYSDQADGKSGNRKLCMECGYCAFKETCWPGLRTFVYARGPVYLTKVVRMPKVGED